MNIEQLSTDKLKVFLSSFDLDKFELDYMSISTDSPGTRSMLKEILLEAKQKTGFSVKNCKLLVEVLPGKNEGCILYLTKMLCGNVPARKKKNQSSDCAEMKLCSYILSCSCLDDTIGAISCFSRYPDIRLSDSSLYDLDGKYFLMFSPLSQDADKTRFLSLLAMLSEFGETERSSPVFEAMLSEHGKPIARTSAVENFNRYFH